MPEPTEEVPVLFQDLEMILAALENGHGLCVAFDLQRQMQTLRRAPEYSALTRQLESAATRVAGYIGDATNPNE